MKKTSFIILCICLALCALYIFFLLPELWIGIGIVLLYLIMFLFGFLWFYPKSILAKQTLTNKEKGFLVENEARRTVIQVAGLTGPFLVCIAILVSVETLKTTRETATKTQEIAINGQRADRFSRAIVLLGDKDQAVKVGAVQMLGSIAKEVPCEQKSIIGLLLSYLKGKDTWPFNSSTTCDQCGPKYLQDRQAALDVLGHLRECKDAPMGQVQFNELNVDCLNLEAANLNKAELYRLSLRCTNLTGIHLEGAQVSNVDLESATINNAFLNDITLAIADLRGAQLVGAQLKNADLRYQVDLRYANLDNADLTNAHLDNADLRNARLTSTCWGAATVRGALFDSADLRGADLFNAQGFTWDQIEKSRWDNTTRLPSYLQQTAKEKGRPSADASVRCENGSSTAQRVHILEGYHDIQNCDGILGWAWDMNHPDEPVEIEIYDNDILVDTIKADLFRKDLIAAGRGNGRHGIFFRTPKDGKKHLFRMKFAINKEDLQDAGNNVKSLECK
jgi:uncharacterized protein YjbI with pentapeptide repeats